MDMFLNLIYLFVVLVVSFIKWLVWFVFNVFFSVIVFIVFWMYNIFKYYLQCIFMIYREVRDFELQKQIDEEGVKDFFDFEEVDFMEMGVIDSCLWEVV